MSFRLDIRIRISIRLSLPPLPRPSLADVAVLLEIVRQVAEFLA